ncbi:variant surface glycoprotein (VSG, atypical), putative [Trypanosoma equiperdum]|uniref:Variant surface glycoprotein (VSG, atypical), putative n=1 Tax=Trypanosoma equiperdum TaxID=5694 RepID=A0A1G4IKM6_TRYEQ|nr:variant surface glycoprotein (VSG, atypical), putative [Trypanosoma equiperdum]
MMTALYGETATATITDTRDPDADFQSDLSTSFPWTASNTRDDECKKPPPTSAAAGTALAADAICLCTKSATTAHDACLSSGNIGSDNMHGATAKTTLATLWGKIKAECDKIVPSGSHEPSAATLTAAAAAYFSGGGVNWGSAMDGNLDSTALPATTQNIIGRYVIKNGQAPACRSASYTDSTQYTGICIDYTDLVKDAKGIAWVSETNKAAAALEKIATASAEQRALLYKAETVESPMEALLSLRHLTQTKAPTALTQTTLTAADCNNHKTNKTCTDNNCKWDGTEETKETCKAKPATETPAAGTGDKKEGAAATGCESHFNDQNACEKMNEGKEKPVCAWKKGGEGDKDKDELRCRNGSFLANKKCALM